MSSPQKQIKPIPTKQAIMRRVVIASVPCIAGSVYFSGWRSLAVVAVSCLFGFLFIEAHGFFQGRGSAFRVEPERLVAVLFD